MITNQLFKITAIIDIMQYSRGIKYKIMIILMRFVDKKFDIEINDY